MASSTSLSSLNQLASGPVMQASSSSSFVCGCHQLSYSGPLLLHPPTKHKLNVSCSSRGPDQLHKVPVKRRDMVLGAALAGVLFCCGDSTIGHNEAMAANTVKPGLPGLEERAQKSREILRNAYRFPGATKPGLSAKNTDANRPNPELPLGATDIARDSDQNTPPKGGKGVFGQAKDKSKDIADKIQQSGYDTTVAQTLKEKKGQVQNAAKDAVAEGKSAINNSTNGAGGNNLINSAKEGLQSLKEGVAQKGGQAKSKLDDAASTAQSKLQ